MIPFVEEQELSEYVHQAASFTYAGEGALPVAANQTQN